MKLFKRKYAVLLFIMIFTSFVLQGCNNDKADEGAKKQTIRTYNKLMTDLKITPDYIPRPYLISMTDSLCYFGQETIVEQDEELFYNCKFFYKALDGLGEAVLVAEIDGPQVLGVCVTK